MNECMSLGCHVPDWTKKTTLVTSSYTSLVVCVLYCYLVCTKMIKSSIVIKLSIKMSNNVTVKIFSLIPSHGNSSCVPVHLTLGHKLPLTRWLHMYRTSKETKSQVCSWCLHSRRFLNIQVKSRSNKVCVHVCVSVKSETYGLWSLCPPRNLRLK